MSRSRKTAWLSGLSGGISTCLFLMMPKCPLCLAAWLTLSAGISCSAKTASLLFPLLLALSATGLIILLGPYLRVAATTAWHFISQGAFPSRGKDHNSILSHWKW